MRDQMKFIHKIISCILIAVSVFFCTDHSVYAEEKDELKLASVSCVLMEASTGTILYEKNKNEVLPPASITKIMTMLIIYEELEKGTLTLDDIVTVSEHAAGMGGSQVFFEPGETQTVEDMLKCISIASANDACVAMAEHISGSEDVFVKRMNNRAKELGMKDTVFINCCGLDAPGHVSSAYDVALMSRELIINYPQVIVYSTTWMDSIIHTTKKGQSEFGLTNTNKLIRQYTGITGLKTGSTGNAKYCLSATANRNNIPMIAVIMSAPDTKTRFQEAAKLLNYGYANCDRYYDDHSDYEITQVAIKGGLSEYVDVEPKAPFYYLLLNGVSGSDIEEKRVIYEEVNAPVSKGEELGLITYYLNQKEIGNIPLVAKETVEKASYTDYLIRVLKILT